MEYHFFNPLIWSMFSSKNTQKREK